MKFDEYRDKTIFITGAASGIGLQAFIENGANVFGFDINAEGLNHLAERFPEHFGWFAGSIADSDHVETAVNQAFNQFIIQYFDQKSQQ